MHSPKSAKALSRGLWAAGVPRGLWGFGHELRCGFDEASSAILTMLWVYLQIYLEHEDAVTANLRSVDNTLKNALTALRSFDIVAFAHANNLNAFQTKHGNIVFPLLRQAVS